MLPWKIETNELDADSVVAFFATVQKEWARRIERGFLEIFKRYRKFGNSE